MSAHCRTHSSVFESFQEPSVLPSCTLRCSQVIMTSPFAFAIRILVGFRRSRQTPKSKLFTFRLLQVLTIGLINLLLPAFTNSQSFDGFRPLRSSLQVHLSSSFIRVGQCGQVSSSFKSSVDPSCFFDRQPVFCSSSKCSTVSFVVHDSILSSSDCAVVSSRPIFLRSAAALLFSQLSLSSTLKMPPF